MEKLEKLFGDIRFWIAVTFLHRLASILQPPLEVAHNWRQTTVTMVARNFLEIDPNIFYPRVDMAGELSGITGMEFPLLNYLIYLVSLIFGYEHWYGRLINLIVSSVGIWCFYDLLKHYFNKKVAFSSAMVLLFSLFYYYSRKIMPDTFSVSLIFAGIWVWKNFVLTSNFWKYFIGSLFIVLGVLSKVPSVMILAFLWPLMLEANWNKRIFMSCAIGVTGVIAALWYFYWVPYLQREYGYEHFFMGNTIAWTFQFLLNNWQETLHMFYVKAAGFSGFVVAFIGLFFLIRSALSAKLIVGFSFILFAILMLKSGDKFTDHEYYIIPFIPVMALLAGISLSALKPKLLLMALLIISVEGVARKWEDQFIKSGKQLTHLDEMLDPYMTNSDLIVINSDELPTPMYFAHRKGWVLPNQTLQQPQEIEQLKSKGCKFILVLKKRFGSDVTLPYGLKADTELFKLYEL